VNAQRETCTINAACTLAGVTRRTIYNWLKDARIEHVRTAGGSVRIYVDTLLKPAASWPTDFKMWPRSPT